MWPFVYKYRLLKTRDYFLLSLIFNSIHSFAKQSIHVLIVNIVGIPTCSQHLLTWFTNRPDDGHVSTETCSLTHKIKQDVFDDKYFIILVLNFNTSGCLQSKSFYNSTFFNAVCISWTIKCWMFTEYFIVYVLMFKVMYNICSMPTSAESFC
jgi:hypothetical protein